MIKDLCQDKKCANFGKYARICGHYKIEAQPLRKINTYSKKRTEINRKDYAPAVVRFLKEHRFCEVRLDSKCGIKAVTVHHVKGRTTIKDLLNIDLWKASCAYCNNALEGKDKEARERGLKISKHETDYKREK